ncbi:MULTISPECIES: hypothetical protein [Rhizobium]|nr:MULTISPECIES: hypothetical protein [Rhizobium]
MGHIEILLVQSRQRMRVVAMKRFVGTKALPPDIEIWGVSKGKA